MDAAEVAQEFQATLNEASLLKQQRTAGLDAPGADLCSECGDPIPEDRRAAMPSAHRCVNCQAWVERIGRVLKHA